MMMTPDLPTGKSLTAAEFMVAVLNNAVQLVDIRTWPEYCKWHLRNAVNIDFFQPRTFENSMGSLDKNRPIFIYCQTGHCSKIAKAELNEIGFQEVYDLEGGIRALKN